MAPTLTGGEGNRDWLADYAVASKQALLSDSLPGREKCFRSWVPVPAGRELLNRPSIPDVTRGNLTSGLVIDRNPFEEWLRPVPTLWRGNGE